jgi:L-rhamnose 1-dehydrogenase
MGNGWRILATAYGWLIKTSEHGDYPMTPHGTRVLITGGSRGIGLAFAEALAEARCDIVIAHLNDGPKAEAEQTRLGKATGRSIHTLDKDVADPRAARDLVNEAASLLGGLDIIVSNAGICRFTPFLEITDEEWQRHVGVNFHGGFYVAQEAARIMVAAGNGGRVIFTTSVGAFRSNRDQTHYCATKGALHLLAQGMAVELGSYGITVNSIAPGWIHTDINNSHSTDPSLVDPWLQQKCSVGRLGTPGDLKAAILFLASSEAAYVNGATIAVDGGWNAQL